jgi:hypothetical protein
MTIIKLKTAKIKPSQLHQYENPPISDFPGKRKGGRLEISLFV